MVGSTKRGTNAITQIGLLVPSYDSLLYWKKRFEVLDVKHGELTTYAGREAWPAGRLRNFTLVLLNNSGDEVPAFWRSWDDSVVLEEHRILGIGAVEMTVQSLDSLANTLENLFGYVLASHMGNTAIYQSVKGQAFGEIVIVEQDGPKEKPGKGSVHHIAIRVKDGKELREWHQRIRDFGFEVMKITDRYYFESLYFREENGILFELATEGPGFTVDSTIESLGKELDLPPFLEVKRAEFEEKLEPIE